jgi:hypothetical protein
MKINPSYYPNSRISTFLQEQRMALHRNVCINAMSNIPENETDNLLQN